MFKKSTSLILLSFTLISSPICSNVAFSPSTKNSANIEHINFISKSIEVNGNSDIESDKGSSPASGDNDLRFYGPSHESHHRIFIDSGNDRNLPKLGDKYDDYVTKAKRNVWHEHLIKGLSIDVTKYALSKADFMEKYKAITFSYFHNYNFWNSQDGWTYKYGKTSPLIVGTKTILLTTNNEEHLVFESTDPNHSSNERARLKIVQRWSGNVLSYDFYLGVRCHWATGSVINHAAIAAFKNDEYLFVSVPTSEKNRPVSIGQINSESEFYIYYYSTEIGFTKFDNEIKKKALEQPIANSNFKTASTMLQGYYGINQVGNETYIYSLMIRWSGFINDDCTLLLNSPHNIERKITSLFDGDRLELTYQNSLGDELSVEDTTIKSGIVGAKMIGYFYLPFIYSQ